MAGNLTDAERLIAATQEAGGRAPTVLTNILSTRDLLSEQAVRPDPAHDILRAGAEGTLTAKKLTAMLEEAAHRQQVATYTGDLRARVEPLLAREFHAALKNGAADELVDSLRATWDTAAAFIQRARAVISPESSVDHFLASADADSDAIALWQGLNGALSVVNQVGAIASQFAPRLGPWPVFKELTAADNYLLEDRALMCTNGPLVGDSIAFRTPDAGHKSSPWFRLPLKLHSVSSAVARYRAWAADQWDASYSGPQESWIDEQGNAHERPRPKNPYRETADA
jgi:hypothetical protein